MAENALVSMLRIKELRQRIGFTLFWLIVFRLGTFLPIPGINLTALKIYFASGSGGVTDYLDFFSGGAFKNFSLFMLGVMPYISAQIIIQLLIVVFPSLKKMMEEEGGRKKISLYTRLGTIVICLIQSWALVGWARSIDGAVTISPALYTLFALTTVTAGSLFLVWIGEQITKRGVGNGVSLIIFAGIVARLPNALYALAVKIRAGEVNPVFAIVVILMFVVVVTLVVYEQQGQRKIPVTYAKRVVGRKMYGGQNTYIPFKINPSGVIPVIFASSLLTLPLQIIKTVGVQAKWLQSVEQFLDPRGAPHLILYVIFIIFFAYFYTQVTLNPTEISKQIRENGGSIPGIRSEKMEEYLTKILNRIVLPGAIYLAMIALIPTLIQGLFKFPSELAYLLGGTSLLILVGVDLDTMAQIESILKMHHHDGLTKHGHIKGRNL
ncbi:MAG TPA: preprotein translocase subunit SecY [Spirochaetia bacterium]|nr:preprotein translocase subunit SecY [Spirochaetales bacterium]HRS65487.1 preprotein translocase subunit SecY [Spirochaetia bacterium]HRV28438.1 preprotein translocase subunit SecY [Spirochaetia bacterium]